MVECDDAQDRDQLRARVGRRQGKKGVGVSYLSQRPRMGRRHPRQGGSPCRAEVATLQRVG